MNVGTKDPVSAGTGTKAEPRLGGVVGAGLLAALLFAAAAFVPALGPLAFLCPVPLAVQRLRGGAAGGWLATALAVALIAAATSPGAAGGFLLALAPVGLLLGEALARGRGLLRGCTWAFGLLLAGLAPALFFAGDAMQRRSLEPVDQLRSEAFLSELHQRGVPDDAVADFREQVGAIREAIAVVFPAAWIIGAALLVIANAALLRLYLLRRDPGWLEEGEFERIHFPLALVAAFILAGASVALPLARPAAYNVLLVVAFFFALQGLAVVVFYARRLAAPPLLRLALLVLVLANPWAPEILALLGLFDNWFDFRRWAEPPREKV
ncbi:MAG TPA: DUF2232 domain-containing protein [Vicinamibacteria bacterium]|nr:DUF2232 domain-containing protein [Vicinamibacteria bacterium]